MKLVIYPYRTEVRIELAVPQLYLSFANHTVVVRLSIDFTVEMPRTGDT